MCLQHETWTNFKFSRDWVDTYEDEVLWTMQKADDMLERLGRFVDQNPEYMLVCDVHTNKTH